MSGRYKSGIKYRSKSIACGSFFRIPAMECRRRQFFVVLSCLLEYCNTLAKIMQVFCEERGKGYTSIPFCLIASHRFNRFSFRFPPFPSHHFRISPFIRSECFSLRILLPFSVPTALHSLPAVPIAPLQHSASFVLTASFSAFCCLFPRRPLHSPQFHRPFSVKNTLHAVSRCSACIVSIPGHLSSCHFTPSDAYQMLRTFLASR